MPVFMRMLTLLLVTAASVSSSSSSTSPAVLCNSVGFDGANEKLDGMLENLFGRQVSSCLVFNHCRSILSLDAINYSMIPFIGSILSGATKLSSISQSLLTFLFDFFQIHLSISTNS